MEQLIRRAIDDYERLRKELAMFERHLEARENAEMREALVLHQIRIGAIESWFTLLDTDEKVALRQAMLEGRDSFNSKASAKWMTGLMKNKLSPWMMREEAIAKIVAFADDHRELLNAIFAR